MSDTPKQLRRWKRRWGEDDFATSSVGGEFFTVEETEYRKLERENADLRSQLSAKDAAIDAIDSVLEACADALGHDVVFGELPGELADLRANLEEAMKDAERYRWLREPQEHVCVEVEAENEDGYTNTFYSTIREELDAAIDAAIRRRGKP